MVSKELKFGQNHQKLILKCKIFSKNRSGVFRAGKWLKKKGVSRGRAKKWAEKGVLRAQGSTSSNVSAPLCSDSWVQPKDAPKLSFWDMSVTYETFDLLNLTSV